MFSLRDATAADLPAINEIYNHFVLHCTCTYQTTPATLAEREAWFSGRGPRHPVIVAEENGQVVAWGSLSAFHKREAYAQTVEDSVYVSPHHQRRGLGRMMLEELIRRARAAGVHSIIAIISADQQGSIELHRRMGFTDAGRLREAGRKFGQLLDVAYMQLMTGGPD
jgi:L-amino acid N-acyltransferase